MRDWIIWYLCSEAMVELRESRDPEHIQKLVADILKQTKVPWGDVMQATSNVEAICNKEGPH